jgi:hypothetical protein
VDFSCRACRALAARLIPFAQSFSESSSLPLSRSHLPSRSLTFSQSTFEAPLDASAETSVSTEASGPGLSSFRVQGSRGITVTVPGQWFGPGGPVVWARRAGIFRPGGPSCLGPAGRIVCARQFGLFWPGAPGCFGPARRIIWARWAAGPNCLGPAGR